MTDLERQQVLDEEHLRLLRIGYFIIGGTEAFAALFGLIYVAMGLFFVLGITAATAGHRDTDVPPAFVGWFLAIIGLAFTTSFAALAVLKFLTARALRLRRSRGLCLISAGLSCIGIPYGTALGIFTFSVLNRPSVMPLFGVLPSGQPPLQPPIIVSVPGAPGEPGQ